MNSDSQISAVDLFCGIGGLTHGLSKEKILVQAGYDIDEECKFAYEKNNNSTFIAADVSELTATDVAAHFGEGKVRLLAGCAPCQPFSSYSNRYRHANANRKHAADSRTDPKADNWKLLRSFLRLAHEIRPELITMENVVLLQRHKVFKDFVAGLQKLDYHVTYYTVRCSDYDVPQKRRRLVLFASQYGPVELCEPFARPKSVRQWIGSLRNLEAGGIDEKDPVHRAGGLTSLNLRRIRASKPGGTWRDWDSDLVTACHKDDSGKSYSPVYGRMDWDSAPTITTQFFTYGTGRFGHPEQDRAISLREGALLQTFPRKYKLVKDSKDITFGKLGRWIGNAVPVNLGRAIGRSLQLHVNQHGKKS